MANYLVPINLDIPDLEAEFADEVAPQVNPLGFKVAVIGMAPAIANAIFHATAGRIHESPIRLEHLFAVQ